MSAPKWRDVLPCNQREGIQVSRTGTNVSYFLFYMAFCVAGDYMTTDIKSVPYWNTRQYRSHIFLPQCLFPVTWSKQSPWAKDNNNSNSPNNNNNNNSYLLSLCTCGYHVFVQAVRIIKPDSEYQPPPASWANYRLWHLAFSPQPEPYREPRHLTWWSLSPQPWAFAWFSPKSVSVHNN